MSLTKLAIFLLATRLACYSNFIAERRNPNSQTSPAPATAAPTPATPAPAPYFGLIPAQKSVLPGHHGIVGVGTCKLCHRPEAEGISPTPLELELEAKRGRQIPDMRGLPRPTDSPCRIRRRQDQNLRFTTAAPKIGQRCRSRHQTDGDHDNFLRSAHSEGQIGCLGCHTVDAAKTPTRLPEPPSPRSATPATRHRGQFSRTMQHRVDEGLLKYDCHNPHGAGPDKLLRTASTGDAICTKCHTEGWVPSPLSILPSRPKDASPATHPTARRTRAVEPQQRQHPLPPVPHRLHLHCSRAPSFHNQAVQYQACTICHVSLHGSNFNPYFFK